jgi:prephenate dehydrogenase
VNIKNIGIIHNREYEEGVLRIEFYDQAALDHAVVILEEKNYKIYKR